MAGNWLNCSRCKVLFQAAASDPSGVCANCLLSGNKTMAEPRWFYASNRQRLGPVSQMELARLAAGGQLKPIDMVLREGTTTWVQAQSVPGVFAAPAGSAAVVPPPLPPSPGEKVQDAGRTGSYVPAPSFPGLARRAAPAVPTVPGFEVLEVLGRGGMGIVYKARQVGLNRLVALKMIISGAQAADAERARFRTEAEAVARLKHPNIVQIHEIGEHEGKPYFALEFIEGGTLAKRLAGSPLPPAEAGPLVEMLARAMAAAHLAGIVHRDLKPANVLLVSPAASAPGGAAKVADFGLAKRLDDDAGQTQTGAVIGTPSYMAPEQAAGQGAGPPADIYAPGAILYECLTSRPPFKAATTLETLDQVRSQEPVAPRALQPAVPRDRETICLKCLHKEPGRRYVSAAALADDLQRFREHRPIEARPAGVWERSWKFTRRNRLAVGSTAVIIATLLVALLINSMSLGRAVRAEATSKEDAKRATDQKEVAEKRAHELAFQAAQMAVQRGQLAKALDLFDEAVKSGHPETVELLLQKARALAALSRIEEASRLLDQLAKRQDVGRFEGEILVLRADVALGPETDKAIEYLRRALQLDLPASDRSYALGLLAESSQKSIDHFREALRHDPYHHSACCVLTLSLLLSGRVEEALQTASESKGRFPDDPNFRIALAMVHALRGELESARRELKDTEAQLGKEQVEDLVIALEFLADLSNWDGMMDPGAVVKLTRAWVRLQPRLKRFFPEGNDAKLATETATVLRNLKAPPLIARSLVRVLAHVLSIIQQDVTDAGLADMRRVLENHPEGSLRYIYGMMLFLKDRHLDAEREFLKAANEPAEIAVRRPALFAALACEGAVIAQARGGKADPAVLQRAANNVRDYYRPGRLQPFEAEIMLKVATTTDQYGLAHAILADWERAAPKNPEVQRQRVAVALGEGDLIVLIDTAVRFPDNPEIQQQRKNALDLLEKFLMKHR